MAGRSATLDWEREQIASHLGEFEELCDADARARREEVRDLSCKDDRWPSVRLECLPTQVSGGAYEPLATFCRAQGLELRAMMQPGVACIEVFLDQRFMEAGTQQLSELAAQVAAAEVRLSPLAAPATVAAALATDGANEPAQRWMQQLSAALDPTGTFSSPLFPIAHGRS